MDELETEFAIKMVVLAGDFEVAFDAFHSQNCNARWAFLPYLLYRTCHSCRTLHLPYLPGSREAHVHGRTESGAAQQRCGVKRCALMKRRVPPSSSWADPNTPPVCDMCEEALATQKYSYTCSQGCDYDCCETCYEG